jgi:O-antigen/teichoic acid export membrane protein
MIISIVTSGIATAWYPFFMTYMERQKEAKVIFGRIFTYYIFGVGFITLCFFLVAKPFILLLTQAAFHDAYIVIGFVALSYFAQTIFNFFLPGIYFQKEIKYVSIVQGLAALISLPINFFLIVSFGILGAAIGLCVSNFLMAGMMYGWNFLNSDRYLIATYEWDRVFTFTLCSLVILVFYLLISVTTTKGEITKSILMSVLTLVIMLLLLNKSERMVLIKKVLGK